LPSRALDVSEGIFDISRPNEKKFENLLGPDTYTKTGLPKRKIKKVKVVKKSQEDFHKAGIEGSAESQLEFIDDQKEEEDYLRP
jgi:hypothetical protein